MKKLYKKSTVHPTTPLISDHLALLPAAIFTLTAALSPHDKEVLAYLISSTTTAAAAAANHHTSAADHPPLFTCNCFRCYTSYWVRWDSSPNRQLIHEIIDAFEDKLLLVQKKREKTKKCRKKRVSSNENCTKTESAELTRSPELSPAKLESAPECRTGEEEGSVRKLVSFLGERIWSVWT